MNKLYFEDVDMGTSIPSLRKGPISRTQLVKYAGASRDFNPVHFDEEAAKKAGMKSCFAQGMLNMAFLGQMLTDWAGVDSIKKFGARFVAIVYQGESVLCKGEVKSKRSEGDEHLVDCEIWAENSRGETVVKGWATLKLPSRR